MYFNIPDYTAPARQSLASVASAMREATNTHGVTNSIDSTMLSVTAAMKNNQASVSNAFSAINMSRRMLEEQISQRQSLANSLQDAIRINLPSISMPIVKVNPQVYDFRKHVAFHNARQGISPYLNERISVAEAMNIENEVFNLDDDQESDIKYKPMTLDNELRISDLWIRINFLLNFIGVDFDYETVSCILEKIVDAIKEIIDNS